VLQVILLDVVKQVEHRHTVKNCLSGCTAAISAYSISTRNGLTSLTYIVSIPTSKENICLKIEVGEYDDTKCQLICFLNFHELLGNLSDVCMYKLCGYVSPSFLWGRGK
jgi:hypothetical protein